MSFNWVDYYHLAEEIKRGNSYEEARYRSITSRAYYAAYCLARNYLVDYEDFIAGGSAKDHVYVSDKFVNSGDLRKVDIGEKLKRLRRWRNRADYDAYFARSPLNQSTYALNSAKIVIDTVQALTSEK